MAGNTRFHNKYHFAQHHSEVTDKNKHYPEATTDPLASEDFPFQGQFHSDGSLQIHPTKTDDHNLILNDTTLDGNLIVNKNTDIKGDLVVEGNVTLKADPLGGEQVIKIGNDVDGQFDTVKFIAFIDSDFVPDFSDQHDLGAKSRMWRRLYTSSLSLSGELINGDCEETPFRGMYMDIRKHKPGLARLGINTCEPEQELHVVGDGIVSENFNVGNNIEGQGNLWIHGNANIDGVVTLQDTKPIRWLNDLTRVYGDGNRMIVDVPDTFKLNANNIDLSSQQVTVALKDSVRALCVDDGTFGIDALNNRVGIGTCEPIEDFHVEGNVVMNGNTIKMTATDEANLKGGNKVTIHSDVNVHIESDETSSWVAGDKITIASPEIVSIAGDMDWDMSKIHMTTQPVQFLLRESSTKAVQFGTCLLNLDAKNDRVGINTCEPLSGMHVVDDVLIEGKTGVRGDLDMVGDLAEFKYDRMVFDNKTTVFKGKVGLDVDDPEHKISLLCGDAIGTHSIHGNTAVNNRIIFCEGTDNTEGWDDLVVLTDGRSDIKLKPGRSVQVPDSNLAIGKPYNDSHPESSLEVRGRTHLLGDLVIESYEQNGQGNDTMNLTSYDLFDIGTSTERNGLLSGGNDNNLVIHIDNQTTVPGKLYPGFGVTYNDVADARQVGMLYSSYTNTNNIQSNFLGVHTNEHKFTDTVARGGDGIATETNVNIAGRTVIQGDTWVDDNLHVNNDQVVDGRVDINCSGTDLQSDPNGLRVLRGSVFITNDNTEEAKMILDTNVPKIPKAGADDLGSGSNTVSNIAGGQKEHLSLDLRNTEDETTFAVRYSGDNDGIADKIGLAVRHYNGEGHVGVGGLPAENEHLHVYGNTKITGNLTVDGNNTIINTANLEVEDAHITLNKSQNQTSNTNNLTEAGLWFQGDQDVIVGYVKVHETDLSKLVAKAPTGMRVEFDINGTRASTIQLNDSDIDYTESSIVVDNSTITIDDATVDIDGDLTVEADSFIDQDLTRDSNDVMFGDLDVTSTLNIPVVNVNTPNNPDPGLVDGYLRYNEMNDSYEASKNGLWIPFDKSNVIKDRDGDTFIEVHEDDNDTITTTVAGTRFMFMDSSGIEINSSVKIDSGDRSLSPMLKITQTFTPGDIITMPANLLVKGLGADVSKPEVASGAEMGASEIIPGNKYIVFDHRGNSDDTIVQIYTDKGKMIIPDEVHIVNNSRVCIDVTSFGAISGKVIISL